MNLNAFPFELDPFQTDGIAALRRGQSVLVVAPTGAGKTVLAEAGIAAVLERGARAIYTAPLKALSNEKARLFAKQFGADRVGVLTGDVALNPEAPLRVMTTEILRNMLLAGDPLPGTALVVFDEFHYLADRERGSVWEQALILLPPEVQVLCLSATAPNVDEIAEWLSSLRGPVTVVRHDQRPVPLTIHYYHSGNLTTFVNSKGRVVAHPRLGGELVHGRRSGAFVRADSADPEDVLPLLAERDMLPCFYFAFSRRRVENLAWSCRGLDMLYRGPASERAILDELDTVLDQMDDDARGLPQTAALERLLPYGIGFHHAGLLPTLKDLVERLFAAGHLGVVFTTATMALGVNMPARTVVLERLTTFDGTTNRPLNGREFHQIIGRAGRRGIDRAGHAVILADPWVPFDEVKRIATRDPEPIESAFRLDDVAYLNLRAFYSPDDVAAIVARSLRPFQLHALHRRRAASQARNVRGIPVADDAASASNRDARSHARWNTELKRLEREIRRGTARTVEGHEAVLTTFGYLSTLSDRSDRPGTPTRSPRWTAVFRSIFHEAAFTLTEFLRTPEASRLTAAEWAELAAWFATDDEPRPGKERPREAPPTPRLARARDVLSRIVTKVRRHQAEWGVDPALAPNPWYVGLVWKWANGAGYGSLCRRYDLDAGDLTGLLADTIGLLRQLEDAVRSAGLDQPSPHATAGTSDDGANNLPVAGPAVLPALLREAQATIWRGPVVLQLAGRVAPPVVDDAGSPPVSTSRRAEPVAEPVVRLVSVADAGAHCARCHWHTDEATMQRLRSADDSLPRTAWCAHPRNEVGAIGEFVDTVEGFVQATGTQAAAACPEFISTDDPQPGESLVPVDRDLEEWRRWRERDRHHQIAELRPRVHAALRRLGSKGKRRTADEQAIVAILRRFVDDGVDPRTLVSIVEGRITPRVRTALLEDLPVRPITPEARVPVGEERQRALRGWARSLAANDPLRQRYGSWTALAEALIRADRPGMPCRTFGQLTDQLREQLLGRPDDRRNPAAVAATRARRRTRKPSE